MTKKKHRIVFIKWLDAGSVNKWEDEKDAEDLVSEPVITIGWLIEDDPKKPYVKISSSLIWKETTWCDPLSIPKCAILQRKFISRSQLGI